MVSIGYLDCLSSVWNREYLKRTGVTRREVDGFKPERKFREVNSEEIRGRLVEGSLGKRET